MCFSAEISFGAAAVISTVGVVSYRKAKNTPYRVLALIPIFFGIQQFAEGLVWVSLSHDGLEGLQQISTYIFIVFAWIMWPIYIPWFLWKLERHKVRKTILLSLVVIGICVTLSLIYIMINTNVQARIQDCSIYYDFGRDFGRDFGEIRLFGLFYLLVTVFSHFVSSISKVWILGVVNLLTYFYSRIYYEDHLISVWCFFAAMSSILILYIIWHSMKKEKSIPK